MLAWLPAPILGSITILFFGLMCVVVPAGFFVVFFLYLLMPIPAWRRRLYAQANRFPCYWGSTTGRFLMFATGMTIELRGAEDLRPDAWYLMLPNHQSFADIMVLHFVFGHKIPSLRFFMKQSLRWIPIVGQVCMALGYPFMKRYTKSQVAKNPKLKGKDLAATQRACERFKKIPVTIVSFVEGTRYTAEKAARQNSPYQHLLKPRAGGIAFTLAAMKGALQQIIHVNLVYQTQHPVTFWHYHCGHVKKIIVEFEIEPITPALQGDYVNDRAFRVQFQSWLNDTWAEKDARLASLKKTYHD